MGRPFAHRTRDVADDQAFSELKLKYLSRRPRPRIVRCPQAADLLRTRRSSHGLARMLLAERLSASPVLTQASRARKLYRRTLRRLRATSLRTPKKCSYSARSGVQATLATAFDFTILFVRWVQWFLVASCVGRPVQTEKHRVTDAADAGPTCGEHAC